MPLPLLKVVQLTLTSRCQCNCEHCGVSGLRDAITEELSLQQIDAILQDLRLAGCLVIDLFGGEPTLRPDLCEIITLAKSYGFIVSLESNGYLLDQGFMNRLEAAGLDQIYLSLDDYRADRHDERRNRKGSFERAVRALEIGATTGMTMHVSIVPQSEEFFLSGDINRFMQFVLEHGAQMVRLLLPRFVGHSSHVDGAPLASGREQEIFSHVSPRYNDYIYVHTPGTSLGETNICTAKHVFCHIMSNGWVAPCPYFPLVFGDAAREPIVDIFERIQTHPLVRLGGDHCPMRNEEYINSHIRKLGLERPFHLIDSENMIDLGSPCTLHCPGCAYSFPAPRPLEEIVHEMEKVAPEYRTMEFYGGDAFLRNDLFEILDRVPPDKGITLWSTCRDVPSGRHFAAQLASRRIRAVKVLLPLWHAAGIGPALVINHELEKTFAGLSIFSDQGLAIHLYVPMEGMAGSHAMIAAKIRQSGVERVYAFTRATDQPLANSVGCFGRALGRVRLLWAHKDDNQ